MRKSPLLLAAFALLLLACNEDDSPVAPGKTVPEVSNKSTSLVALEAAFNERNLPKYDQALDDNFTFYPAPSDVSHGFPVNWDRASELIFIQSLFDPNYVGPHPVKSIDVDIIFPVLVQWTGETHGDETWYSTTLFNQYEFDIDPDVFSSPVGAKVRFVVRNAGTEEHAVWKIVEWWDLGGDPPPVPSSSTSLKTRTWGQIKLLHGQ